MKKGREEGDLVAVLVINWRWTRHTSYNPLTCCHLYKE